ncbi:hypothetical protein ABTN67_20785, partial [Acinetobacter baumannii]
QRYFRSEGRQRDLPVEQMRAFVFTPDKFEQLRVEEPDWYELPDGIHSLSGTNADGSPFSYRLAVRKTPDAWFFLAYDMTQATRGEQRFYRALVV